MKKQDWRERGREAGLDSMAPDARLLWCISYLESDFHHEQTPTTYYGDHDPFDVPISPCAMCQSLNQKVWKPKEGRPAWRVVCKCGASGGVAPYPRKAIFRWNKSPKSLPYSYAESPLFGIQGLAKEEALERLQLIYNDLSLKTEIAVLRSEMGERVAKGYIARLMAYLDWVQYLEDVIKDRSRSANKLPGKENTKTVA